MHTEQGKKGGRIDTDNNARALLIIQEDFPRVAQALNLSNLDSRVAVGFIDTGKVSLSRPVGLEVDGEILNLSIADTWAEMRNRKASPDNREVQEQHQRRIDEFMKRKFPDQYPS